MVGKWILVQQQLGGEWEPTFLTGPPADAHTAGSQTSVEELGLPDYNFT